MKTTELGFDNDFNVFINYNLNQYFERLGWKCRVLKRNGEIHSFRYQNEAYFLYFEVNGKPVKIRTDIDIEKLFPNFVFPVKKAVQAVE